MLSSDKVVPFTGAPDSRVTRGAALMTPLPGLSDATLQGFEASYPGTLTAEMKKLLRDSSGLAIPGFGDLDFTGQHYPQEPISVLRPSITLMIDHAKRRWIAETSAIDGLPGPVWCVLQEPAVALPVSADLSTLLRGLQQRSSQGRLASWLRALEHEARQVWTDRRALARRSYDLCRCDRSLGGWLFELPTDAQVYDLRAPITAQGWPYGVAGAEGRFYRCGRLPVFAVAHAPRSSSWQEHMARVASHGQVIWPAAAAARVT